MGTLRQVIGAAIIEQRKILLVKKKDVWILPGGKPESGEDDLQCLIREAAEELPGLRLSNFNLYRSFVGKSPHQGDQIILKIYLATRETENRFQSGAEITAHAWLTLTQALDCS